ncbi:MAG: hypothetical protein M0Q51_07430 [Bacteroidales bacterium]|nr:hypothetical protein [Bacteroidales bacterium]
MNVIFLKFICRTFRPSWTLYSKFKCVNKEVENESPEVQKVVDVLQVSGYFKNKQDKFIVVKIHPGQKELRLIISQREKYVFNLDARKLMYAFD